MRWLLLFLLFFPVLSHAKIYIVIDEASSRKFPIAIPEFLTEDGKQSPFTQEMTRLFKKDLELLGIFKVLDERYFLESNQAFDETDFSKWTAIEAFALIKGMVSHADGGKFLLEVRLYDTEAQRLLVGKQYRFEKKKFPEAVHRFMDEVMRSLTGTRGPFESRIAAACGLTNARQIQSFSIDKAIQGGLTKNKANNISPNWSPDGGTVAFTSFINYFPEIYSVGSDGKGFKQLTHSKATNITPAFSPNGSSIVFGSSKSGDTDLYLMTPGGRIGQRLTQVLNIDVSPAWSPDGLQIVFASERAGNLHLFSMPVDGGTATRLTYTGYQNDQPDWSPDGRKIVFTSRDSGTFDIFVMNSDGSFIQRITRMEGSNESPTWSPDSRYVAFSSSRGSGSGIYVMLADGNNQTLIPNTGGCINPDWSGWLR